MGVRNVRRKEGVERGEKRRASFWCVCVGERGLLCVGRRYDGMVVG